MHATNPARSADNRLGNWHDLVDEAGNGSLIAQLKRLVPVVDNDNPVDPEVPERDPRNRFGNWHDIVDEEGNGSVIAQMKRVAEVIGPIATGNQTFTFTDDGNVVLTKATTLLILNKETPAETSVVLPAVPDDNYRVKVKDGGKNSGIYAITVTIAGGATIDGEDNYVISSDGTCIEFAYDKSSGNYFIIGMYV